MLCLNFQVLMLIKKELKSKYTKLTIPSFAQSCKLNKYSSILLMLVDIINLDPETGIQNILPVKRLVQEASLQCIR